MRVHGFVLVHGRGVSWPASLLGGTCHQAREHLHTVSSFIWKNDNERCLYQHMYSKYLPSFLTLLSSSTSFIPALVTHFILFDVSVHVFDRSSYSHLNHEI